MDDLFDERIVLHLPEPTSVAGYMAAAIRVWVIFIMGVLLADLS